MFTSLYPQKYRKNCVMFLASYSMHVKFILLKFNMHASGFVTNGVSFGTISSTGKTSGSKTMLLSGGNFPRTVEVTRNGDNRVGKGRGLFFFMKIENAWEEHSRWEPRTSLRCRTAVSTAVCPLLVTAYGNCSPVV